MKISNAEIRAKIVSGQVRPGIYKTVQEKTNEDYIEQPPELYKQKDIDEKTKRISILFIDHRKNIYKKQTKKKISRLCQLN